MYNKHFYIMLVLVVLLNVLFLNDYIPYFIHIMLFMFMSYAVKRTPGLHKWTECASILQLEVCICVEV